MAMTTLQGYDGVLRVYKGVQRWSIGGAIVEAVRLRVAGTMTEGTM